MSVFKAPDEVKHSPEYDVFNTQKTRERKERKPVITIGVAGCMHRIGTTTQAMQIVQYLFFKGKEAYYVEKNGTGFLKLLEATYQGLKTDENGNMTYNRLTFVREENIHTVIRTAEYLVYDYGCVDDEGFDRTAFTERNHKIVVAGSKPEELLRTTEVLKNPFCLDTDYVFSFTPKADENAVLDLMTGKRGKTFFSAYIPDYFTSNRKMDVIYGQILGV